jgi:oligoendopeptidase F
MPTQKKQKNIPTDLGELPVWNLSSLYDRLDDPAIKADVKDARTLALNFRKLYSGKLADIEAVKLAKAIEQYSTIQEKLGKLGSYAQLVYAKDMASEKVTRFYQDISERINEISSELLFFTLALNRLDEKLLHRKIDHSEKLAHYRQWLRDVRVFAQYQLSDELEEVLHEKSLTGRQAWNRLFDETLADLRFPFRGEEKNCAEILNYLSSHDEDERKDAALAFGEVLKNNSKIFAFITNTLAKDKAIEDELRNYARPISYRNRSNFIEDEVVDALITAVRRNYANLAHRYYALKAQWLGKSHLEYWDRNAPLPDEDTSKIPWEKAQEIVLDAYENFSPEMAAIGKRFFEEGWIDAPTARGKDSGAFSHPTVPSANPFILMNYQGKLRDIMTLAHELGHGVHQVLSAEQGVLMADTPLTLAETASVFGEQLTFRRLLQIQPDASKRKTMIAGKVEDMLNTVVRQVAFCEFERQLHDKRKEGELSVEEICNIWMQIQAESLGPAIKLGGNYKYFWQYIPHFIHSPFYVYSYAFGDCLVNALYTSYQEKPKGFEEKYLTMLRAGGTLWHKELLAPFGLDATDPNFWQKGLDVISGFIDELEKM